MKKPGTKALSKSALSKVLFVTGCLCIAASIVYEACSFPWGSINNEHANEIELRDPNPPDFDYIDYKEATRLDYEKTATVNPEPIKPPDSALPSPIQASPTPVPSVLPPSVLPGEEDVTSTPAPSEKPEPDISKYVLLGIVKIPRISMAENLFEGAGEQMKAGLGHVEGTALPGEQGNVAIAGHRISSFGKQPFRHLDKMKSGDTITVRFDGNEFIYEVFDLFIVSKEDVWVLDASPDETNLLTLVTCDPVLTPASRANRLIVRARLMSEDETD